MKKLLVTIISFLFLFISVCSAKAEQANLQQVISTIEQGYSSLKDLQASFSQTTLLAGFPKPQKGHGELALRRPAKGAAQFRFDYVAPKQSIISNGKQVWFYQPENRQVLISSLEGMMKGGNSIAMSYLTGLGNISKDFKSSFAKPNRDKQGNYIIELTPRNPTPLLSKLRLAIMEEAVTAFHADGKVKFLFPLVSSTVIDSSGTETTINYSNIRTNIEISGAKFNFKVPKDVEIIKP